MGKRPIGKSGKIRKKYEKSVEANLKSLEKKKREYINQLSRLNIRVKEAKAEEKKQLKKARVARNEFTSIQKRLENAQGKMRISEKSYESQIKELESVLKERKEEFSSLQDKIQLAKTEYEQLKSGITNMKMADAMLKLLLAADHEGLEKWLTHDSSILLEYIRSAGSSPFTGFYRRMLYEALLGKAYSYYRCSNCNSSFHAQEGKEPHSCPYCSSQRSSLQLIDIIKEASPESESGIPLLPSPS